MKPQIIFILRHNSEVSKRYSVDASNSCDKLGLKWEYFEGFSGIDSTDAWRQLSLIKIDDKKTPFGVDTSRNKAALCTASHVAIWKKIVDEDHQCAIILEHDALMLHKLDLDIPDHTILALGYKIPNPSKYKHEIAGPPARLQKIDGFNGSHAYAITKNTAQKLIDGIKYRGTSGCIDTHYFQKNSYRNGNNLMLCDPVAAIGWIRESTIWQNSSQINRKFIPSFKNNLK